LWVDNDHVELKDARGIWGKLTWETDDLIKKEVGDEDIEIISIGPAGENLVRGACIIGNRNRAAGRCGLGAIMGSKNLKAVAIRGTGSVEVAQPDRFMEAVDGVLEKIKKSSVLQMVSKYGPHGIFPANNEVSTVPYKNFQSTQIPQESAKQIDPDIFLTDFKLRDIGYMACPIACSNFYRVDYGPYAGLATEGFELNCTKNFAGKLALDYAPALIKAHALCNQLGMDMDNATGPISWAFECYQRGILTEEDTDGLKLQWGDHGVVFELLRKLAYREGFGNLLAEGCKHASEILGRDSGYYAISMKGQDLYEEVRLPIGWGFGVCVATRGGGHTTGAPVSEWMLSKNPKSAELGKRIFGVKTFDLTAYEDKAKLVIYTERIQELVNSLGLCMFFSTWEDPDLMSFGELAELYSSATGWETTEGDLVKIADRILNVEKAFNVLHANLGRGDDYPSERFFKEPITSGPFEGFLLSKEKYDDMLDEYYQLRGWDKETGLQTKKSLQDLDLADVANDLEEAQKLIHM
jgi:aldehyde:ferredoxin oxidoreductase